MQARTSGRTALGVSPIRAQAGAVDRFPGDRADSTYLAGAAQTMYAIWTSRIGLLERQSQRVGRIIVRQAAAADGLALFKLPPAVVLGHSVA